MFLFLRSQALQTALKSPMHMARWSVSCKSLMRTSEAKSEAKVRFESVDVAAETP